jgi:hypothetical protein
MVARPALAWPSPARSRNWCQSHQKLFEAQSEGLPLGPRRSGRGHRAEKVPDYGASLDIEGEVGDPFGGRRAGDVVEPITLSVGYQLSRLEKGDEMVHIAQAKASIPISAGGTLPLAMTMRAGECFHGGLAPSDHSSPELVQPCRVELSALTQRQAAGVLEMRQVLEFRPVATPLEPH